MPVDEPNLEEYRDPWEEALSAIELADRLEQEESKLPSVLPSAQPPRPAPTSFEQTMAFQPRLTPDLSRAPGVPSVAPPPFVRSVQLGPPRDVPMTAAVPGPTDMRSLLLMQQYEASEGYRRDIAQGMSQADAMAKWGPTMFASRTGTGMLPKTMTAGGQLWNVFGGSATPITPPINRSTVRTAGGQLWNVAGGAATALTPPLVKPSTATLERYRQLLKDEGNARVGNDLAKLNRAIWDREAFEAEHPELTGATPNVPTPQVAAPKLAPPTKRRRGGSKEKLARAQELEEQYPDASKAEILDMLKAEFY